MSWKDGALRYVLPLESVGILDVPLVGGKNASLGELSALMAASPLSVSSGFVVTAAAYQHFVEEAGIGSKLSEILDSVDPDNVADLAQRGKELRELIKHASWPADLEADIRSAYRDFAASAGETPKFAVRSSATAEDLPDTSFAGQHDSFLNVGGEDDVVSACRDCFASLFTDRAIIYRMAHGFEHMKVNMSVGVQMMVDASDGASGVTFTVDPETACPNDIIINSVWGLGEGIVSGAVDPDEHRIFKPLLKKPGLAPILHRRLGAKIKAVRAGNTGTRIKRTGKGERDKFVLSDTEALNLAKGALLIEEHYGRPMDIEWVRDANESRLYIVQARPETGHERRLDAGLKNYSVGKLGPRILSGIPVGDGAVSGKICKIGSIKEAFKFKPGSILVAPTTDPDWAPLMKQAEAIVTDHGGRTSHAAIVCREFGLAGIVGTQDAMAKLEDGQVVTVSSLDGHIYDGAAEISAQPVDLASIPSTRTRIMLNLADPDAAGRWWRLPADGIGLARIEFIINSTIKAHPMAFARPEELTKKCRQQIAKLSKGWTEPQEFFVDQLAFGMARIASVVWPRPAIVRLSDFKTNEYAKLLGGSDFEPDEENPMIGWRGASRYYDPNYAPGFALECKAALKASNEIGLSNIILMVPFCRTLEEADHVLEALASNGLERGKDGLEIYMMAEIPSNAVLAAEFAKRFDGFSIGSNDLTQLTLGVDRDSERLSSLFREDDRAVMRMIEMIIAGAKSAGIGIGLCGQAPSNDPSFADFLVHSGIDSISVTPDSFAKVKARVSRFENRM